MQDAVLGTCNDTTKMSLERDQIYPNGRHNIVRGLYRGCRGLSKLRRVIVHKSPYVNNFNLITLIMKLKICLYYKCCEYIKFFKFARNLLESSFGYLFTLLVSFILNSSEFGYCDSDWCFCAAC